MGSSDNFCLRWNDFETNISSSFRELRQDKEFFDVTLCCDNGSDRVGAHKVILAACSPFFRRILGGLNSQGPGGTSNHPLLYLKGIQKKELQAVLNFMYHGEVNVAQESLNAFLSCAEELAVKGLTTDSKPMAAPSTSAKAPVGADQDADFIQPSVKPSPASKKTPSRKRDLVSDDVDSETPKKIKPEPETVEGADEDVDFVPDDYGGGAEGFDDSYGGGGGGFDDMDDSAAMDGSETTKDMARPRGGTSTATYEDLLYEAIQLFAVESERCNKARGHKWHLVAEYYNKHLPIEFPKKTKEQLRQYAANKNRRLAKQSKLAAETV